MEGRGGEEEAEREVEGRPITVGPPLIVIGGGRYLFFVPKNGAGEGEAGSRLSRDGRESARKHALGKNSVRVEAKGEEKKSVSRQASYIQTR